MIRLINRLTRSYKFSLQGDHNDLSDDSIHARNKSVSFSVVSRMYATAM